MELFSQKGFVVVFRVETNKINVHCIKFLSYND